MPPKGVGARPRKASGQPVSRARVWLLVGVAGAALAMGVLLGTGPAAGDGEPPMRRETAVFALTRSIPDLAQRYVRGAGADFPAGWNRPAVFKGTDPARQWLARSVLPAPRFWQENMPRVPGVRLSDTGVFSFFKMDRPLSPYFARHGDPNRPAEEMAAAEWMRLWKSDSPNDPFVSFSEVLHRLPVTTGLHDDVIWPLVIPFESLLVNDTRPEDPQRYADSEKAIFRLWAASGGARTVAHHDWSHNWYVLLTGVKRFVLYPPNVSAHLYMYPFLHPHATKLQPNVLSKKSIAGFSHFPVQEAQEVILEAGDVLYVPPYWFHDVSTLEPAMAIAVWSPSRDDGLSDALLALGLPVSRTLPLKKQLRLLFIWTAVLLDAAFSKGNAAEWLQTEVIQGRYGQFAAQLGTDESWINAHCPRAEARVGRYSRAKSVIATGTLQKGVALVERISQDARGIVLGNYVEVVLHEFVHETPEKVYTVLKCFHRFLDG